MFAYYNFEKIRRISIDKKLTFKHIENFCRKAQYKHKPHVLRCVRKLLTIEKAKILSQFNYAPLLWMVSK